MISESTLAQRRLLVVGDTMLDRYWFGDAHRISPEAPVPVVRVLRDEDRLGGAANVAVNIASLGAGAALMSVVGDDDPGNKVHRLLARTGIEDLMHTDLGVRTTVKLRLIARNQQLVRIDFEDRPTGEVLAALTEEYERRLPDYHAVILSDYSKGGLEHVTRMIQLARGAGLPLLVDPKGSDFTRYRGATLITPNRSELASVVGRWNSEDELREKAQKLRRELELEALLLTRSEEGMTLYTADGELTVPAQAREVFDVSGAGDTVIAVLATMLSAGLELREAVLHANRAAGLVVAKVGTASVSYEELFAPQE